jgi:hypothetical protein
VSAVRKGFGSFIARHLDLTVGLVRPSSTLRGEEESFEDGFCSLAPLRALCRRLQVKGSRISDK